MGELVEYGTNTRVHNWHGKDVPGPFFDCGWCGNDGIVFVGWSRCGTDQMAPCPYCEVGFRAEFGKRVDGRGAWGSDGYWRGRQTGGLERLGRYEPLPVAENRSRLRALAARVAELTRDLPKPGVVVPAVHDGARREAA